MSEQVQVNEGGAVELDCLFNWMRFLAGPSRQHAQGDVVVRVYGELDDSYVVIEKRTSPAPRPVGQYVLLTGDSVNSLMTLFRLLKEFQFDLKRLIAKLETLRYGSDGRARLEGVEVGYRVCGELASTASDEPPPVREAVVDEADPDATLPGLSLTDIARSLAPVEGGNGGALDAGAT